MELACKIYNIYLQYRHKLLRGRDRVQQLFLIAPVLKNILAYLRTLNIYFRKYYFLKQ